MDYVIEDKTLKNIADAIRTHTGNTSLMSANLMVTEIANLENLKGDNLLGHMCTTHYNLPTNYQSRIVIPFEWPSDLNEVYYKIVARSLSSSGNKPEIKIYVGSDFNSYIDGTIAGTTPNLGIVRILINTLTQGETATYTGVITRADIDDTEDSLTRPFIYNMSTSSGNQVIIDVYIYRYEVE